MLEQFLFCVVAEMITDIVPKNNRIGFKIYNWWQRFTLQLAIYVISIELEMLYSMFQRKSSHKINPGSFYTILFDINVVSLSWESTILNS